jgi:hypothetical protein
MHAFSSRSIAGAASLAFLFSAIATADAQSASSADLGTPPSGEIPILFNDMHVYSKPDRLKKGRVLAALVRGKTILVPLRSMFEQMGATVSYDAATRTVDVSKPGADVRVAVGKPEVVINGETRPLDVPPEIYKGALLVPLRVISEGMGAYVLWVPDRRVVVVRYLPAPTSTPPPPAPPPAPPVIPAPTAAPTAVPTAALRPRAQVFIVGDALFTAQVSNAFDAGVRGGVSESGRVGIDVPVGGLGFMAEGNLREWRYPHQTVSTAFGAPSQYPDGFNACGVAPPGGVAGTGDPGCVTTLGGNGSSFVPAFVARDTDIDGRIGVGIFPEHIYIVGSYDTTWTNYGYPRLTGGGVGLERLPNLSVPFSLYASFIYYPEISGNYVDSSGRAQTLEYSKYTFGTGATFALPKTPLFLDAGYLGDRGNAKENAPVGFTHTSIYGGLGLHF